MDAMIDPNTPRWKKDLIARLRNKNKWFSDSSDEQEQQLLAGNASVEVGRTVQQPNLTCSSSTTAAVVVVPVTKVNECDTRKCNEDLITMVKDRVIDCDLENLCVSSDTEELHYGPGIVKKLKNHYLSLTLRVSNSQVRPSILPLRKATSLENLLDDGDALNNKPTIHYSQNKPRFKENETKNSSNNRYYNTSRGVDLKRAYSVEAISRSDDEQHITNEPLNDTRLKHQSFHEDMLIVTEGNGVSENILDSNTTITSKETTPFSNTVNHKINRPKRITPLMSEKEKPPVDVVKQTKRIFEGKAEERTKQPYHTGDVAAKVASYKNIIQTKNHKKPIISQKPAVSIDNQKAHSTPKPKLLENGWKSGENEQQSPPDIDLIPDVSIIVSPREEQSQSLSETPDLILHSSPVKNVHSPSFRILATDNFLKAEVVHSNNFWLSIKNSLNLRESDETDGLKVITAESRNNIRKAGSTITFKMPNIQTARSHLPSLSSRAPNTMFTVTNIRQRRVPEKKTDNFKVVSSPLMSPLTVLEIEKNHKNSSLTVSKGNIPAEPLIATVENNKNSTKPALKINTSKQSYAERSRSSSTPTTTPNKATPTTSDSSKQLLDIVENNHKNSVKSPLKLDTSVHSLDNVEGIHCNSTAKVAPTTSSLEHLTPSLDLVQNNHKNPVKFPLYVNTSTQSLDNVDRSTPKVTSTTSSLDLSKPSLDLTKNNHKNSVKSPLKINTSIRSLDPAERSAQKVTRIASPLDTAENVQNVEVKKNIQVPKTTFTQRSTEQNSIVFKFTNRRNVPDYVHNDGKIRAGKMEKPKVGEGGIILLPGASLDESLVDDGDDWTLILEGPPSPCDIEFVNGNILIDGRSSLSQKSRKSKMRIKFVDTVPEIFEYPSETSLAYEYNRSPSPLKEAAAVNSPPTNSGTLLANYIPKVGSAEEFQLGITRSTPVAPTPSSTHNEVSYQDEAEPEKPVLFSAGTNSDILF